MKAREKNDDIYTFDKNDIKKLRDRVLLNDDVCYKNQPASNRHRGITPMQKAILSLIYKTSRIAESLGKEYIGLTLFDCQEAFKACTISNDTVRDNIRKLWRQLKFLKRILYKKTSKSQISYYTLNDNRFPCKDGVFILFSDGFNKSRDLWALSCPIYPFCSGLPKDCQMVDMLSELKKSLNDERLSTLSSKMDYWRSKQDKVEVFSNKIIDLLKRDGDPPDLFDFLSETEISYFSGEIIEKMESGIKEDDGLVTCIDEIREEIIEEYEEIKRENEKANRKKEQKKKKKRKSPLEGIP